MTLGSVGSMTMEPMARLAIKSFNGNQLAPPSRVFQTPPPTVPTHIVFGVEGWIRIERTRPPILPGPNHVHAPGLRPATFGPEFLPNSRLTAPGQTRGSCCSLYVG